MHRHIKVGAACLRRVCLVRRAAHSHCRACGAFSISVARSFGARVSFRRQKGIQPGPEDNVGTREKPGIMTCMARWCGKTFESLDSWRDEFLIQDACEWSMAALSEDRE